MSHGHGDDEGCKYGHMFEAVKGDPDLQKEVQKGEIESLDEYMAEGEGPFFSRMGEPYKQLKVAASGQGLPYMLSWTCADEFDEELGYDANKTSEDIFVAPQSNLHQEFSQRKQQAEQRVNQTLSGLSDLEEQKHLLEHDIRKLRSRAEAVGSHDEIQLKADFVELVDGSGGGAQQGSEEAPLKTLRDQNIYPSIVADFYEMDDLDDLRTAEKKAKVHGDENETEEDYEDGKLANLPANERAILKKKYTMYEKWKDLYGSEVQRKLNDLKAQLNNIERSIEETKNNLEPYVRDLAMINPKDRGISLDDGLDFYPTIQGTASMRRDVVFVCHKKLKKTEYDLEVTEDEDEATHYRVVVIHSVHVNLASGEQPNSPAQGPSSATISYYPLVMCKHVFENIFEEKINKKKNRVDEMLEDYVGEFDPGEGLKFKNAREEENWSVRKLRREIGKEVHDDEKGAPIELSANIRRIEDGLDEPETLKEDYDDGGDYLDAWIELLDVDVESEDEDHGNDPSDIRIKLDKLTGKYWDNDYVIPEEVNPVRDLANEMKFGYYYGYKIGLGLNTMK